MSISVFSRSSVKSIDKVILDNSAIKKHSKDSLWVSESSRIQKSIRENYDKKDVKKKVLVSLRISLKNSKAVLSGRKEEDLVNSFYSHYSRFYWDDNSVMSYINDQFAVYYHDMLTRWFNVTDFCDRIEAMIECISKFRMACVQNPMLECPFECNTCNPFVRKPNYVFVDEGFYWVTKRFKTELQVHNNLNILEAERFHESIFHTKEDFDFFIPNNLNEEVGGEHFELFYEGANSIKSSEEGVFFPMNDEKIHGVFRLKVLGIEYCYNLTEKNSTAFKSLLIMLNYYKVSPEEYKQRGCIESIIWGGQDELLFAHSIDIVKMFQRAEDDKGFYLADLSFLGNFHLLFGSKVDIDSVEGQELWLLYNYSKDKAFLINLAIMICLNYGLSVEDYTHNALVACKKAIIQVKDVKGLRNKASKKFIFEFCSLSNDLLGTKYTMFEKLKMSDYVSSIKFNDIKKFSLLPENEWVSTDEEQLKEFDTKNVEALEDSFKQQKEREDLDSKATLNDQDKNHLEDFIDAINYLNPEKVCMKPILDAPYGLSVRMTNEFYKNLPSVNEELERNFKIIKSKVENYMSNFGIKYETDQSLYNRGLLRQNDELNIFSEVRKKRGFKIYQTISNAVEKEIHSVTLERLGERDELLQFSITKKLPVQVNKVNPFDRKGKGENLLGVNVDSLYEKVPNIFRKVSVDFFIKDIKTYKTLLQSRTNKSQDASTSDFKNSGEKRGSKKKNRKKNSVTSGRLKLNSVKRVNEFVDSFKISSYQTWNLKHYGSSELVKNKGRVCINKVLSKNFNQYKKIYKSYKDRVELLLNFKKSESKNTTALSKYILKNGLINKIQAILLCYSLTNEPSSKCVELLGHKIGISSFYTSLNEERYKSICMESRKEKLLLGDT